MFTDQYIKAIETRLDNSLNERNRPGHHLIERIANVLVLTWEPGDMTQYVAYAVQVPNAPEGHLLVCGIFGKTPFLIRQTTGGFLNLGYFLEKCPTLLEQNLYSRRKLCQMVAALLDKSTDANDPIDYSGE